MTNSLSKALVLGTLALCASSCKPRTFNNASDTAEFAKANFGNSERVAGVKLKQLSAVPHDVSKRFLQAKGSLGFASYNVSFSSLSDDQFQKLKAMFGSQSDVKYRGANPQTPYELVDFMPKTIQALWEQRFIPQDSKVPGLAETLHQNPQVPFYAVLSSTPVATAFEVVRNDSNGFVLFFASGEKIEDSLLSDAASQAVEKGQEKFGDMLLILSTNGSIMRQADKVLVHAAVHIDGDLYFEKSGNGPEDIYRFVTLQEILSRHVPEGLGGRTQVVHRRIKKDALAHPGVFFTGAHQKSLMDTVSANIKAQKQTWFVVDPQTRYLFVNVATIPFVKDEQKGLGRMVLSHDAYSKEFFSNLK